ncbi:MAG: hypothetical protein ACLR17_01920 [Enterobacteriaceae bacterium]
MTIPAMFTLRLNQTTCGERPKAVADQHGRLLTGSQLPTDSDTQASISGSSQFRCLIRFQKEKRRLNSFASDVIAVSQARHQ